MCGHRQSWGGGVQCGGKARPACEPNTHSPRGGDGSRGGSWCGWTAARGSCVISREAWVGAALGLGGTSAPPRGLLPQFPHLQGQVSSLPPRAVLNRIPVSRTTREAELRGNYYPAIEKYEIAPFAATGTDLAVVTLSEVSRTDTNIV